VSQTNSILVEKTIPVWAAMGNDVGHLVQDYRRNHFTRLVENAADSTHN
jgi:hypothetical protein